MSGLAQILMNAHFTVSGSDACESKLTKHLIAQGAAVYYGHRADNISPDTQVVIYTAAIHDDNPEIIAAKKRNIPLLTRAKLLGQIMKNYKTSIGVSGTHGKTTTTSFKVGDKKLQDIFTAAENADESSKIFADASNESVRASMSVDNAATADTAIKAANKKLYGVEDSATSVKDLAKKIDSDSSGAANGVKDAVTANDGSQHGIVNDIIAYNAAMKAANTSDLMIDTSALSDYISVKDSGATNQDNKLTVTASGSNSGAIWQ